MSRGSGVAPQTPIPLHTMGRKKCFWKPGMGVFEMEDAQQYRGVQRWRPKHPYLYTPWAEKRGFGDVGWGCLKWRVPQNIVGFTDGTPNTHTSAHHVPGKVFLNTYDGGV